MIMKALRIAPPPEKLTYTKGYRGFTLAEVLITLGIIGIVATLTLPALITKQKAKILENQFKKSYSSIQQAFILTKNNLGIDNIYSTYTVYDGTNYTFADEFTNTLDRNLQIRKIIDFYPVKNYNKTKITSSNIGHDYPNALKILPDGSSYGTHINFDGNKLGIWVYIDINGPKQKPNTYGHDIFKFEIGKSDKLLPLKPLQEYTPEELENSIYPELLGYPCNLKSNQGTNGAGCSYYAVNNICPYNKNRKYWECLP